MSKFSKTLSYSQIKLHVFEALSCRPFKLASVREAHLSDLFLGRRVSLVPGRHQRAATPYAGGRASSSSVASERSILSSRERREDGTRGRAHGPSGKRRKRLLVGDVCDGENFSEMSRLQSVEQA